MIFLLLLVAVILGIPATIEVLRNPEENIVVQTREELQRFYVRPMTTWVQERLDAARDQVAARVFGSMMDSFVTGVVSPFRGLWRELFDLIWKLVRDLIRRFRGPGGR